MGHNRGTEVRIPEIPLFYPHSMGYDFIQFLRGREIRNPSIRLLLMKIIGGRDPGAVNI
jgi:hypothetical protein